MILYVATVFVTLVMCFKFFKKSTSHLVVDTSKYVFITGCDSGFGLNTAKKLDSLGFSVIATCKSDEGEQILRNSCSKNLHVVKMDVTDSKQVQDAYDYVKNTIKSEEGMIVPFVSLITNVCGHVVCKMAAVVVHSMCYILCEPSDKKCSRVC